MARYKVGDRVRIVSKMPDGYGCSGDVRKFLGKTGTVKRVNDYLVTTYQFEEIYTDYHGFKYYPAFSEEWIAGLVKQKKESGLRVVIRFDGNVTTARMICGGTVVKTATARRNPADNYSRAEGARVAVERLFKKTSGKAKDASKPKIGDKFVVVGRSADVFHAFDIGTIVTLIHLECDGCNQYRNDFGLSQYVSDRDVKPYKEKIK